jgi:hypothetical protein
MSRYRLTPTPTQEISLAQHCAHARYVWNLAVEAEKTSTSLARRFDVIRVENLRIPSMTRSAHGTLTEPGRNIRQKARLNRGILASG